MRKPRPPEAAGLQAGTAAELKSLLILMDAASASQNRPLAEHLIDSVFRLFSSEPETGELRTRDDRYAKV